MAHPSGFNQVARRFPRFQFSKIPDVLSAAPDELRRSSVRIAFRMVSEADERLVAEGWGTLVGYDYEQGRAAPFPEPIARRLRDEL